MLCGSFLYFIPLLIQLLDYFGNALRGLCNNASPFAFATTLPFTYLSDACCFISIPDS